METTITKARQITLPAEVLKRFGLATGEKIKLVVVPDGILLIPKRRSFKSFAGGIKVKRWEDVSETVEKEREKDITR